MYSPQEYCVEDDSFITEIQFDAEKETIIAGMGVKFL
jgi:hypothetical protein